MRTLMVALGLVLTCSVALAWKQPAVKEAFADSKGRVHIVTADGGDRLIPAENGQDGVDKIQVAPDGRTVGWLNLWDSCCVSYPIPTELVIWRSGRILRRIRPIQAIWNWAFLKEGTQIAYRKGPLHGGWSGESTLMDVATGKILAAWDRPTDENGNDTDKFHPPDWAKDIQ